MVDDRVMRSKLASEAKVKEAISSKEIEVNVISHKKQKFAVWFGGSLLADTVRYFNSGWFQHLLSHKSSIWRGRS